MNNMKKVLLLHSSDDLYGASKIFLDVTRILIKNGFEVSVFISGGGPLYDQMISEGINVQNLRMGALRRQYLNPLGLINRAFYLTKAIVRLSKIIKKEKFDYVFSNTTSIINGAVLKMLFGKKISHYWHIHEIIDNSKIFNGLLSSLMSYMDKGICVSNAVLNHWQSISPKNAKKFLRIYNGYVPKPGQSIRESLGLSTETMVVTMIGRINKMKGPEFFVEIAKKYLQENENTIFLIAGDCYPGYEYLVDELIERIGTYKDSIIYLGFREDVNDIMASSDVFVLPSVLPDPLPTVILEAMSRKLPIVTTTTGGAGEMVFDGDNGFHIDVWDIESACSYIKILADDESRRRAMGERSFQILQAEFVMPRFEKEILTLFE